MRWLTWRTVSGQLMKKDGDASTICVRETRKLAFMKTTSCIGRPLDEYAYIFSFKMRQKGESASLAERLNNALAQQHAQKLAFDAERNEMQAQLQRANEEN